MSLRFLKKRQRYRSFYFWGVLLFFLIIKVFILWSLWGNVGGTAREIKIGENLITVKLWDVAAGRLREIGLESYVWGVVAAEMPASFPLEALKAQAVAARTYAVKRLSVPDSRVKTFHEAADLCSDPAVNQAWLSASTAQKKWGQWNYVAWREKIKQAVRETAGEVLLYKGQLIDPVYHASCGGQQTENSEDVWQFALPYLRGVACTDHQDRYVASSHFFTWQDCDALLGTQLGALSVGKITKGKTPGQIEEKSPTARVQTITLGGQTFSGVELRTLLALPSTRFTCHPEEKGLRFVSNGYGHGVGLCQYGAADLAAQGQNYREILGHYYTGVQMGSLQKENV